MTEPFRNLDRAILSGINQLKVFGEPVEVGTWQGVSTVGKPDMVTREILNLDFYAQMPATMQMAQDVIEPNLPWAETEHLERVGGEPHNPHHSLEQWPWWRGQVSASMISGHEAHSPGMDSLQKEIFSHTYSERFWPRVGLPELPRPQGIRYLYGDLSDVVALLRRDPQTRQAYVPIFFPEDTGAVHGGRIPCTLGYHFLLRDNHLHLWYEIRSCDAVRHFRDDIYLAVRLCQWMLEEIRDGQSSALWPIDWDSVVPGNLYFKAHSFHVHASDQHLLP